MGFRKDINGLRAIAVIAVVLFHFSPEWLPGGFAGVDIFFVISGFLMTKIIFNGLEKESFRILEFYIARANRIIPTLALVCLVLFVFCWFYLSPLEYKSLAKHISSSMIFLSNVIYLSESGYFDVSSYEKWLLHTWSLSVEWQFYIIYPLIIVTINKFMNLQAMKITLLVATFISFTFSAIITSRFPDAAYYLLPTRAWEMMMGGVVYLFPLSLNDKNKIRLEILGFILILTSYVFISKDHFWPGYLAIIPVLGASFIIQSQRNDSVLTNNSVLQSIGKWSYSIYLWHWPLVVAGYYFELPSNWIYIGIFLSIILGFLSNKYIESIKFKTDLSTITKKFRYKPMLMAIILSSIGTTIYIKDGYLYQIPKYMFNIQNIDIKSNNIYTWERHNQLNEKEEFVSKKDKILIIGDSQTGDLLNMLFESEFINNYEVITRKISAACNIFYVDDKDIDLFLKKYNPTNESIDSCKKSMGRVFESNLLSNADYIFVAFSWKESTLPFISEAISELKNKSEAKLYLFGLKFLNKGGPYIINKAYKLGEFNNVNSLAAKYRKKADLINGELLNVSKENEINFINMLNFTCPDKKGCVVIDDNDDILFYDKGHTTKAGALYIGKQLKETLRASMIN
ncbi:Peptidoglycan/LPS O-acetylase OafA/YrhL [Vibrio chagasii]|nr:Acyltransferase [Vibrio chagasii]CAH7027507.1 Peptidoglycan/LPS O-acetylase OafA/YrhL [Vibrio chagasii]CAH7033060.1 Peptidoglycan/LPS O-acetylase OafA/YrhL [Vibrio chagasii]CAH7065867.1 Acyltransferase [Vibrio chagasii]CAH7083921.1 Peptidoglycan/LPS O-acetylase OafA/YrhL [Vibrio chagasii]